MYSKEKQEKCIKSKCKSLYWKRGGYIIKKRIVLATFIDLTIKKNGQTGNRSRQETGS